MSIDPETMTKMKEAIDKKIKANPSHATTLYSLLVQYQKVAACDDDMNKKNEQLCFEHYKKEKELTKKALTLINSTDVLSGEEVLKIEKNLDLQLFDEETKASPVFKEKGKLEKPICDYENIWYKMITKCEEINAFIQEEDKKCLVNLRLIELIREEDSDGMKFNVNFHFKENEFFSDSVLTIKAERDPEGPENELHGSDILIIESDKIHWKQNKDLTTKFILKKQRNKRTGETRTVKKTEKKDSFFNIFCNLDFDDILDDEENSHSVEGDPTSNREVFFMTTSVLEMVYNNMFTYLIPVALDLTPEAFKLPDVKEVNEIAQTVAGQNGQDCKQQ